MAIQSDIWIRDQAQRHGMIEPFVEAQRREGCISYGLSSYGYDARVADEFKIFTNVDSAVVDPKDFASNSFVDRQTDVCVIPPNSFALARTVEYFRVPRDVLVICLGKSTYARCGIIVNVTPLEPGWEGHVTLEFSNTTPLPAKIYANEGACQFLFLQGNEPCETSYADRAGKFTRKPTGDILAIDRIKEIHARIPNTHLVMHGSSSVPQEWLEIIRKYGGQMKETYGVPVEEIVTGIKHGVRKVNIDTDIRLAMTGAMRRHMAEKPAEFDPRKFLADAQKAAKEICKLRYEAFGCAGQAAKIKPVSLEKMAERYKKGELNQIVK